MSVVKFHALCIAVLLALVCAPVKAARPVKDNAKLPLDIEENLAAQLSGSGVGIDLNRNLKVDPLSDNATALDQYMAMPDPEYSWSYNGTKTHGITPGISGWTYHHLVLTSQRWLTEQEAGSCSLWQHDMLVVIPDNYDNSVETAMIWITDGLVGTKADWPQNVLVSTTMATMSKSIVVCLFQVPNQRCTFPDDPKQKSRGEDAVIAYTWRKYIDLKRKGDPRADMWPVRLPMVKASIRAMDATTEFLQKCTDCTNVNSVTPPDTWVTCGASKRGWTTWLTGAVDKRVIAEVPVVMDALNQHKLFHRWYQNMGGWSFAIKDYTDEDLMAELDSPEFQELLVIIDPYHYLDRFQFPKLVISATGDEFFQTMDDHYWFKDMPGKTLLLKAANADHSEATGLPVILPTVSAFVDTVIQDRKALKEGRERDMLGIRHPELTWNWWYEGEGQNTTGYMNVTIDTNNGPAPDKVWLRHAYTQPQSGRLDFRWFSLDEDCPIPRQSAAGQSVCPTLDMVWAEERLSPIETTANSVTYHTSVKAPEKGWAGFNMELQFPGISELFFKLPYTITTQTALVPDTTPFPDCSGAECEGKLV